MQIVNFPASIAVLLFAAILFVGKFDKVYCSPLSSQPESNAFHSKESTSNQEISNEDESSFNNRTYEMWHPWRNRHQSEELLWLEGGTSEKIIPVDCCPSILEMSEPRGGINTEGHFVKLYRDESRPQQFHQISCRPDVLNQPCRFMEKHFHNRSRCVQKYSYSYAIVIQPDDKVVEPGRHYHQFLPSADEPSKKGVKYVLDYIEVRSGCSCEIWPNKKYKSKSKNKSIKRKERKPVNDGT